MNCPKCGTELLRTNFNRLFCPNCGIVPIQKEIDDFEDKDKKREYIR